MSGYKAGTQNDPAAPWNEQPFDEVRRVKVELSGEMSLTYDRRWEPSEERVRKDMIIALEYTAKKLGLNVDKVEFDS